MELLLVIATILIAPFIWVVMLALGNFGFAEFGYIDCIPAGMILGALAGPVMVR